MRSTTFRTILALALSMGIAFTAANPISNVNANITERQSSCGCQSPSGCPGHCAPLQGSGHSYCIGYCGRDNAVVCDSCGLSTDGCIVPDNGACFTVPY